MSDALNVFFHEKLVGVVHRQADDRIAFEYADSWLDDPQSFSISISLPLAAGLNRSRASHAFFANLLPEGNLRVAVARQLGISISNDFALLEAIGGTLAVEIPKTFDAIADAHSARHGDSPIIQRIRQSILRQCRRTLKLMNR